jgi:hypothetical protein
MATEDRSEGLGGATLPEPESKPEPFQELDPALQDAFNDILMALSPVPEGYIVEAVVRDGSVVVYYQDQRIPEGLGFSITAKEIAEGGYLDGIRGLFADLMAAVQDRGAFGAPTNH